MPGESQITDSDKTCRHVGCGQNIAAMRQTLRQPQRATLHKPPGSSSGSKKKKYHLQRKIHQ